MKRKNYTFIPSQLNLKTKKKHDKRYENSVFGFSPIQFIIVLIKNLFFAFNILVFPESPISG